MVSDMPRAKIDPDDGASKGVGYYMADTIGRWARQEAAGIERCGEDMVRQMRWDFVTRMCAEYDVQLPARAG